MSFETPEYTANADTLGTLRILEAVKFLGLESKTRIYQASTSGQTTMVRDFVKLAFLYCGIELEFKGQGVDEIGVISSIDYQKALNLNIDLSHLKIGQVVVKIDPRYFRPTEVDLLLGDPSQAQNELGWKREFSLPDLVDV